jgi:type III pantothenate kinase
MLLVVDVGNTQTHFGTFDGATLVEHWRFATVRESTADELGAVVRNLLALRGMRLEDLTASIVSSTVPQLRPEWTEMASRYLGHEMPVVGPAVRTGMAIRMDNPRELGADRLVNAVAAHERLGGPCVAVDFGTAMTFDIVSAEGEYIGGIIAPGVEISMEALTSRAAAIPKIDLTPPRALIGKGTVEAIRSGVIYGFAAQVDGIVRRLRGELGEGTPAIATGGLASSIVPFCSTLDEVDELLTLTGLRLIWERNEDRHSEWGQQV